MPFTEKQLMEKFEYIPWRQPVLIRVPNYASGLGCRICIAMKGLKGEQVKELPQSLEEFEKHMREQHPEL